jgi:hypothetical protein
MPDSGKTKEQVLAEAGLTQSTANVYEELVGGRYENGYETAMTAVETYLNRMAAAGEVPDLKGLRAAIRGALTDALGPPPERRRRRPGRSLRKTRFPRPARCLVPQ